MPVSIMLDAGHGGRDPGAVYNGRREKDDTLRLVLAIGEILQNNEVDVLYTRTTDVYESPYQKAVEANEAGADYFVSIHRNSFPTDNTVSGVESLVYDLSGIKLEMAENINSQLETVGFVNLGVKARPNLVVLRRTQMPAVLVEVGFLNSDVDNQLFDENFDDIAQAIATGILDTIMPEMESAENGEVTQETEVRGRYRREPMEELADEEGRYEYNPNRGEYQVQVGAFRIEVYAKRLLDELLEQDFPAQLEESDGYYRVRVGEFQTLDEAANMERRLKQAGYSTVIVKD